MGMFSFKCAISGIEIAGPFCGAPTWMNEIAIIKKDHTITVGTYDGYGRIATPAGDVEDFYVAFVRGNAEDIKICLADLYKGESHEELLPIQSGEFQGHFFNPEYFEYAEGIKKEVLERTTTGPLEKASKEICETKHEQLEAIEEAVSKGEEAFWEAFSDSMSELLPDMVGGDLPPMCSHRFHEACVLAGKDWSLWMEPKETVELREYIESLSDDYDTDNAMTDLENGSFSKDNVADYLKYNIVRMSLINGQRKQALQQAQRYGFEPADFNII